MHHPDDEALMQQIQPVLELDPNTPAMSKHRTRTWSLRSAAAATTDASSSGSSSPPQTPTTKSAFTSAASS
jgi:hypothetical protein